MHHAPEDEQIDRSVEKLLSFLRQCDGMCKGKRENHAIFPTEIHTRFLPIKTTGGGSCFSFLLTGKEILMPGLRALVAYHMNLNEEFSDNLPASIGTRTTRRSNKDYAEILEVIMVSYI